MNDKTLDICIKIITTHGLAVFLVVFYAFVIYPESQSERSAWIQEITKVRMLVDPASRPINSIQADAVSKIVIDQFIAKLRYSFQYNKELNNEMLFLNSSFTSFADRLDNFKKDKKEKIMRFEFLGKVYSIELNSDKDKFFLFYDNMFEGVVDSIDENKNEAFKLYEKLFTEEIRANESIVIQLERLSLNSGTLEPIWRSTLEDTKKKWLSSINGKLMWKSDINIQSFLYKVSKSEYYNEWSSVNNKKVKYIKDVEFFNIYSDFESLSNQLEVEMSKKINSSTFEI